MSPTFRADLHCHSTSSDGSYTPTELILLAKEKGLKGLSITDHDTMDAYSKALPLAKELGVQLGTGIEISAMLRTEEVHILGYDFDPESTALRDFCAFQIKQREERNRAIVRKLTLLKMPVSFEKLEALSLQGVTIGRPHIAELMVEKGYVKTIREAFDRFLGTGRLAFIQRHSYQIREAIECIHLAGGKAFIAHPHLLRSSHLLRELLQIPFDGIECYYGLSYAGQETRWLEIAERKRWLVSGGSDFHGKAKPNLPLGASWIDETRFRKIFTRET